MKIKKIGFEFEILVRQVDYHDVYQAIYGVSKCLTIGSDPSVKGGWGWRDMEIKTNPLGETKAAELFNKILALLIGLNHGGAIKTNNSCGLHVNISTGDNFYSYIQIIEQYDDRKELIRWNRLGNTACPALTWHDEKHRYDDAYEFANDRRGEKYNSVALRNNDDKNGIRIENRIIGGKDYILRDSDLDSTIRDFFHVVKSGPDVWPG